MYRYVYPVSPSWTNQPDCLRDSFSSSLTHRGNDDAEDVELAKEMGHIAAVTTIEGINLDVHTNPRELKLVKVGGRKNFLYFRLSLRMGFGALFCLDRKGRICSFQTRHQFLMSYRTIIITDILVVSV